MIIRKFKGCEHLDFSDSYIAEKQLLGNGGVFWLRKVFDTNLPAMVQFCKLRGRLNDPEACLSERKKRCSDYVEIEHTVEVKED